MQKIYSTQLQEEIRERGTETTVGPNPITVSLLKQFARIFNFNQAEPELLSTYIPN